MKCNGMAKTGKNSSSGWNTCARIGYKILQKDTKTRNKLNTHRNFCLKTLEYILKRSVIKKERKK